MKLVIQIPCLNEAESLHRIIQDLPEQIDGIDEIEILVIDDGSTDGTAAVALGSGVDHVVRHNRIRGLAAAFATGLDASLNLDADIIVNTDGDGQYCGRDIPKLIRPLLECSADIVVGDRQPASIPGTSFLKRSLYQFGAKVVSFIAGAKFPDPVSGLRAYSREAARSTHIVTEYSYTIESLVQSQMRGLNIQFVKIATNSVARPSRLFRSIPEFVWRSALTVIRISFMYRSHAICWTLSATLALIGAVPILRFLLIGSEGEESGHVQSLILGSVSSILSGIAFLAGLFADQIATNRKLLQSIIEHQKYPESTIKSAISNVTRNLQ